MITSLHSPHVEAVKALLDSRSGKERRRTGRFIVEGESNIRELLHNDRGSLETLYLTEAGRKRFSELEINGIEIVDVSPQVMSAMTDTVTPQGVLALAKIPTGTFSEWISRQRKNLDVAYFWQLQDPGNAGTVIRTADAFGFDAVLFSDNSVDVYSPKVVRSSVGSHWHLPIFEEVTWSNLLEHASQGNQRIFALDGSGKSNLASVLPSKETSSSIWIFGNEARGLPDEITSNNLVTVIRIPMRGKAESLNLASAAAIVMYEVAQTFK